MSENSFQILQVDEMTILDAARNPVPGYRVYFTWAADRKGHVDLPKLGATKDVRDRLIEEEIARQEALWG